MIAVDSRVERLMLQIVELEEPFPTMRLPASSTSPPLTDVRSASAIAPVIAPMSTGTPSLPYRTRFPAVRPSPPVVTTP